MGRERIKLIGAEDTRRFAAEFTKNLKTPCTLALFGDLGAGKTTFMQGLVRGLKGQEEIVQSPTFIYLHIYPTHPMVHHFDLYRLRSADDFLALGFDEYFDRGITAIEWPERIENLLPKNAIRIYLKWVSQTSRQLVVE
jgi:tRNA threonylcarbamoyladenosine biosynthesis protein TsaE